MRLQVQVTLKNNYNGSAKHFSSGNDSQSYTGWLKLSLLMLRKETKPVPGKGSEALGFHLHVKTIIWIKPQGHQGSSPTPEWGRRRLEFLVSHLSKSIINLLSVLKWGCGQGMGSFIIFNLNLAQKLMLVLFSKSAWILPLTLMGINSSHSMLN